MDFYSARVASIIYNDWKHSDDRLYALRDKIQCIQREIDVIESYIISHMKDMSRDWISAISHAAVAVRNIGYECDQSISNSVVPVRRFNVKKSNTILQFMRSNKVTNIVVTKPRIHKNTKIWKATGGQIANIDATQLESKRKIMCELKTIYNSMKKRNSKCNHVDLIMSDAWYRWARMRMRIRMEYAEYIQMSKFVFSSRIEIKSIENNRKNTTAKIDKAKKRLRSKIEHRLIDTSDPCMICLDEEGDMVSTKCGHIFHVECILLYIHHSKIEKNRKPTCPTCRMKDF